MNCYNILGVKNFASPDEIKMGYRKLSKKFHPDVNDGDKFFEEKFKEIQLAYEILTDPRRKSLHDEKLRDPFTTGSHTHGPRQQPRQEYTDPKNNQTNEHKKNAPGEQKHQADTNTTADPGNKKTKQQVKTTPVLDRVGMYTVVTFGICALAIAIYIPYTKKSSNRAASYTESYTITPQPSEIVYEEVPQKRTMRLQPLTTATVYFTIGSTKEEVLRAQGNPTSINRYEGMGEEVWDFGLSSVTFRNGKVRDYANHSDNLNVRLVAKKNLPVKNYFTIGSSRDEVIQIQGTPTGIHKYEGMGEETWDYGLSSVTFRNGKVRDYANHSTNLRVALEIRKPQEGLMYFTVGSTKDEVLQVQGSPSGVQKYEGMGEEQWDYELSSITFRNGKVAAYANHSGNLRVQM